MKVLFLSTDDDSGRSVLAKAILEQIAPDMDVFARPVSGEEDSVLVDLLVESELSLRFLSHLSDDENTPFDYLITIYDMNKESLPKVSFSYAHKLHLDFADPAAIADDYPTKMHLYRNLLQEMRNELSYFYSHILKSNSVS